MNTSKNSLNLLINLIENTTNTINISKFQNLTKEKLYIEFKLKLIHSEKAQFEKNTYKKIIPVLKTNTHIVSNLKMLYLINYKDRFDQSQIKRSSINYFNHLHFKQEQEKKKLAYKNTETINGLYQLYQIKNYSNVHY
jgi:hypothetical protein